MTTLISTGVKIGATQGAKTGAKAAVLTAAIRAAKIAARGAKASKKGVGMFATDMAIGVVATQGMGAYTCSSIEDKKIQEECINNAMGLKGMSREDWITMVGFALAEMAVELALGPIGLILIFVSIGGMLIDAFWDPLGLAKQMSLFQALGMRHTFLEDIRKSSTKMADPDDPDKKIAKTFTDPMDPQKVYKSYDEVPDKFKDIARMRYPYKIYPKDYQTPHLSVIDYMVDYMDHIEGILTDGVYRDKMTLPAYQMNLKNDYWKHVLTYFKDNGLKLMLPMDKQEAEELIFILNFDWSLLDGLEEIPDVTTDEEGKLVIPDELKNLGSKPLVTEHTDESDLTTDPSNKSEYVERKYRQYKATTQAIQVDPSSTTPKILSSRSSQYSSTRILFIALFGMAVGAVIFYLAIKWGSRSPSK